MLFEEPSIETNRIAMMFGIVGSGIGVTRNRFENGESFRQSSIVITATTYGVMRTTS